MRLTFNPPTLETKHNASMKTAEKLLSLLFLSFAVSVCGVGGCCGDSPLHPSGYMELIQPGLHMLYRLLSVNRISMKS